MVGPAASAHLFAERGRRAAQPPLRRHPGVAADPSSSRVMASGDRRCAEYLARPDEALVFKTYESLKQGCARWTAHTAFDDPMTTPDARPRESIEIRTLAFF